MISFFASIIAFFATALHIPITAEHDMTFQTLQIKKRSKQFDRGEYTWLACPTVFAAVCVSAFRQG
jgi:hypothetical protein